MCQIEGVASNQVGTGEGLPPQARPCLVVSTVV